MLGDLVYIKGDDAEKTEVVLPEHEDNSLEDAYDCSQLDEISGKDLLLEKNNLVKVSCHIFHLKHFKVFEL